MPVPTPADIKSARVKEWNSLGKKVTFRNYSIHCFYQEGKKSENETNLEPLLVLLHGYPTCSYDFFQFIQSQSDKPILTFDFLGFGLSDKPPTHDYSLVWQADLVEELVRIHNTSGRPVVILGHDMGTSVATELLARDIEGKLEMKLSKVCLFNGNMIIEQASFILGQVILRSWFGLLFSRYTIFEFIYRWQLGSVFSQEYPITAAEAQDQWELLKVNGGDKIMDRLIQYTYERQRLGPRWHGALRDWKGSLQFAWGLKDPVATASRQLSALTQLRPGVPVIRMETLGHYPHIENAKLFVDELSGFLAEKPAAQ